MVENIQTLRNGSILEITIDRPQVRNALNARTCLELSDVLDSYQADDSLLVAILTGAGDRAFCAGHDLLDGFDDPMPPTGWAGLADRTDISKPLIAAVNGFAYGGGFEIALACDIVIAEEGATFSLSEPRVGFAALGGGIERLITRIPSAIAMGILLTGRKVPAAEAHRWGLVTEVVPNGSAVEGARRWAEEILGCSPAALRCTKSIAMSVLDGNESHCSMVGKRREFGKYLRGLQDTKEGIRAFAEKRRPVWTNR